MVGYVTEEKKGKLSLFAMFVAFALAVVGIYLMATITMAKPALAVSCSTYAAAPKASIYGLSAHAGILCNGDIRSGGGTVQLQRLNSNGTWSVVDDNIVNTTTQDSNYDIRMSTLMGCGAPWVKATYRSVFKKAFTYANNGYKSVYAPRYSGKVSLTC